MGEKSLEKFNRVLVGNLLNELLFYIPENKLTKEFATTLENIDVKNLFNKVFIMDKMQGPIKYNKDAISKAMMKTSMLEESMYLLLKKQKKLKEQEFSFVFDNYFEQAEFCFYITNWFHKDLKTNTNIKLSNELFGIFQLQYQGYKKHFEKLIKHLYPKRNSLPTGNFDVKTTIEKYFPELLKKYSEEKNDVVVNAIESNPIAITNNQESTSNSKSEKNKKKGNAITKQPLITAIEAEQFLLESVFSIDFTLS